MFDTTVKQYGNPMFPQEAWAEFSPCDRYRYKLSRLTKCTSGKKLVWCMLNPSTANAFVLDPTLRKCMKFTEMLDFSQMMIVNVFAFRSTNPKELYKIKDPEGPINIACLAEEFGTADAIICGWGQEEIATERNVDIDRLIALHNRRGKNIWCLGTNKNGSPKHPLYLPYTTKLRTYGRS